jgi:hypothetical protein
MFERPVVARVAANADPVVKEQRARQPGTERAAHVPDPADATADVRSNLLRARRRQRHAEERRGCGTAEETPGESANES